jgi:hypothetical protein
MQTAALGNQINRNSDVTGVSQSGAINSSLIHTSHSMRPSAGDPKLTDLQQKHKELRRLRRELQMQQMQEQNKAENFEIITLLYKKKRILFALKNQMRVQILMQLLVIPFTFFIAYSVLTLDTSNIWGVLGALCYFELLRN